jgi:hypothetical protein
VRTSGISGLFCSLELALQVHVYPSARLRDQEWIHVIMLFALHLLDACMYCRLNIVMNSFGIRRPFYRWRLRQSFQDAEDYCLSSCKSK